jgi:2-dehydropantoate 2-reductase
MTSPIAVVGAGAVGCYFGGMLTRAGADVVLVGRPRQVGPIEKNGLRIDGSRLQETIAARVSADPGAVQGAGLVLLAVKTPDTETAVRSVLPYVAPDAVILSLQNGVDNVPRIRTLTANRTVPAVVYVAAEMIAPDHVRHTGRGDLLIGHLPPGDPPDLASIAGLFERAEIPCRVSDRIEADLWTKLIMNCAYNAISALAGARYGLIADHPASIAVMDDVVAEALAVARAAGVPLVDAELFAAAHRLGAGMGAAISSTAQDLGRGKPTEIDALNGYVVRRGNELGVPTPVNHTLRALVKIAEAARAETV